MKSANELGIKPQIQGLDTFPMVRLKKDHTVKGRLVGQSTHGKPHQNYVMLEGGAIYKADDVEVYR